MPNLNSNYRYLVQKESTTKMLYLNALNNIWYDNLSQAYQFTLEEAVLAVGLHDRAFINPVPARSPFPSPMDELNQIKSEMQSISDLEHHLRCVKDDFKLSQQQCRAQAEEISALKVQLGTLKVYIHRLGKLFKQCFVSPEVDKLFMMIHNAAFPLVPEQTELDEDSFTPTHTHVKSGGAYEVICYSAMLQTENKSYDNLTMVVYRNAKNNVFCRPHFEFNDGRFIPPQPIVLKPL